MAPFYDQASIFEYTIAMDARPYQVRIASARKQITITFEPVFWNVDVADRLGTDCRAAVLMIGYASGRNVALVDVRNAVSQSKEVYKKMQAFVGSASALRIALDASSPRAQMQTRRFQLRDNVIMFADVDEAQAWLNGDSRQAA